MLCTCTFGIVGHCSKTAWTVQCYLGQLSSRCSEQNISFPTYEISSLALIEGFSQQTSAEEEFGIRLDDR